jgi:hypothetical protein
MNSKSYIKEKEVKEKEVKEKKVKENEVKEKKVKENEVKENEVEIEKEEKEEKEKEILVHPFSFIAHQQTYKIIQKIKINGINYRIDDLDNLYDFTTFKFLKNLNIDE